MSENYHVSDHTDWIGTPVARLAPVEAALRCQVCKDFFDTPMITSCSHTFCSLCIRRCLTHDGRCPTCRASDQELRLRSNTLVEELVDAFQLARAEILQLGQDIMEARASKNSATPAASANRRKRRRTSNDDDYDEVEATANANDDAVMVGENPTIDSVLLPRRSARTKAPRPETQASYDQEDFSPSHSASPIPFPLDSHAPPLPVTDDGLAACPVCHQRMPEVEVFSHLDIHTNPQQQQQQQQQRQRPRIENPSRMKAPMERLPQMHYSLMNDAALRKKFASLGIPNSGPRNIMIRRHTEWMNLVNANCDSRTPRSKQDLLRDLETWERTQGRQLANGSAHAPNPQHVMHKEFDGKAWTTKHNDDFNRLISDAREKARAAKMKVNDDAQKSEAQPESRDETLAADQLAPKVQTQPNMPQPDGQGYCNAPSLAPYGLSDQG